MPVNRVGDRLLDKYLCYIRSSEVATRELYPFAIRTSFVELDIVVCDLR